MNNTDHLNLSSLLSSGNNPIQPPTTPSVNTPPSNTARTAPNQRAVTPDSNSPSSLDAPMNIELMALTRPRIESGVRSCTRMPRIYTLSMSPQPSANSASSDTMKM